MVNYRTTKGDQHGLHSAGLLSKPTRPLSRPRRPAVDWKLFPVRHACPSIRLSHLSVSARFPAFCSPTRGAVSYTTLAIVYPTLYHVQRQVIKMRNVLVFVVANSKLTRLCNSTRQTVSASSLLQLGSPLLKRATSVKRLSYLAVAGFCCIYTGFHN